jgi:hypothetical protein
LFCTFSSAASLNVCDKQGCTPLYHAVIEHQVDVVKELIGHKQINLDRPSTKGLTPLLGMDKTIIYYHLYQLCDPVLQSSR